MNRKKEEAPPNSLLSYEARERVVIGICFFIAFMMTVAALKGPEAGIPTADSLTQVSGVLESHSGMRGGSIQLRFGGNSVNYVYPAGAGETGAIFQALCDGCQATVWADLADYRKPEQRVYQIAVNGQMIRKHQDARVELISNRRGTPVLAVIFWIISIGATCYKYYRKKRA
jgi:hypothetical protein